jgi:methionyl-tRNA formyltransferase
MSRLRVIFMGSDLFSIPALLQVYKQAVLLAVVTQPDKPRGRGLKFGESEVKQTALKLGVKVFQPESLKSKEIFQALAELNPDLIVTAAYGKLVPPSILSLPPLGCINIHPSLLPKYRGASPIEQALLNGDSVTGISIFYMDAGWDTGEIIIRKPFPIEADDNSGILRFKLGEFGAEVLEEALDLIQRGEAPRLPQDNEQATYAPMIKKENAIIDWKRSAYELFNLVRAFTPKPGAYTIFRSKHLKILKTRILPEPQDAVAPGTIRQIMKNLGIVVQTGKSALLLLELLPEGRKAMSGAEFINGFNPKVGETMG